MAHFRHVGDKKEKKKNPCNNDSNRSVKLKHFSFGLVHSITYGLKNCGESIRVWIRMGHTRGKRPGVNLVAWLRRKEL